MVDATQTSKIDGETGPESRAIAADLLSLVGLDAANAENLHVTGADPVYPAIYRIGTAAAGVIGAASLAVAEVWRERTGRTQWGTIDKRHEIGRAHG